MKIVIGRTGGTEPGVFETGRSHKNAVKFTACREYTYREKLNGQWIEEQFYESFRERPIYSPFL